MLAGVPLRVSDGRAIPSGRVSRLPDALWLPGSDVEIGLARASFRKKPAAGVQAASCGRSSPRPGPRRRVGGGGPGPLRGAGPPDRRHLHLPAIRTPGGPGRAPELPAGGRAHPGGHQPAVPPDPGSRGLGAPPRTPQLGRVRVGGALSGRHRARGGPASRPVGRPRGVLARGGGPPSSPATSSGAPSRGWRSAFSRRC